MGLSQREEMSRRQRRTELLFVPIYSVFKAVSWLYRQLGGQALDRRNAHRADESFRKDLELSLGHLFRLRQARFEALPASDYRHQRYFDDSRAVIATDELRLRFQKGRGDLIVQVASPKRPSQWEEVSVLLTWFDGQEGRARQQYRNWSDSALFELGDFLEQNWDRIVAAATAGDE